MSKLWKRTVDVYLAAYGAVRVTRNRGSASLLEHEWPLIMNWKMQRMATSKERWIL